MFILLISSGCTVYVAVPVVFSPGCKVLFCNVTTPPSFGSVNVTLFNVTLPVFSTSKLYVTTSPSFTLVEVVVLTRAMLGVSGVVTVTESLSVGTGKSPGGIADAIAVFIIFSSFISL